MARIVLVAGEDSGDWLGAGLIEALGHRRAGLHCAGIAGPRMTAAGCEAWYPSDELAVMGLAEVLRHLPRLRRVMRDVVHRLRVDPPDLYIGIDAPDFNLRVERHARRLGIATVHYVSPSVWAWRAGRVRTLRAACDHVLCLLPFEADFLAGHGIAATFVGHPLADALAGGTDRLAARRQLGLPDAAPVLAMLPGSRQGEVSRLMPVFAGAVAWLRERLPGMHVVVPVARPALREPCLAALRAAGLGPAGIDLVDGQAHGAMAASDVVLLASGTATLEAMLLERPMVVAYRVSPLTYHLLKTAGLVKVSHVSLPNLLAAEGVVPELLQHEASAEGLGRELLGLFSSAAARQRQVDSFRAHGGILRRDASARAAEAVLGVLDARGAAG